MSDLTYVVIGIEVPESIKDDKSAIDSWLSDLQYDVKGTSEEKTGRYFPSPYKSELILKQFPYDQDVIHPQDIIDAVTRGDLYLSKIRETDRNRSQSSASALADFLNQILKSRWTHLEQKNVSEI